MATNTPSVDEAVERARRVQDARINAVREVAEKRQQLAEVREHTARELAELQARLAQQVSDAERDDARAYSGALKAGWTADELKKIGFDEPDHKRRSSRRRSPRRPPSPTGSTDANGDRPATGEATSASG
jgi:hypothetical protein